MKPIRNIEKANKILKRFNTSRVTPMNVLNFYCKYCCPYADKHQFNPRRAYSCTDIHYDLDNSNTDNNTSNNNNDNHNNSTVSTRTADTVNICPVAIVKQQIYTAIRNNVHINKNDTPVSYNTDTTDVSALDTIDASIIAVPNPDGTNNNIPDNPASDTNNSIVDEILSFFKH